MKARFRMVGTSVWRSRRFRQLSQDGKTGYLYLLTNDHSTSIGAFELPLMYMCDDIGIDAILAKAMLSEIEHSGLIDRDKNEEVIRIDKWFVINPVTNAKHLMGTLKALLGLPSCSLQFRVLFDILLSAMEAQPNWRRDPETTSRAWETATHSFLKVWRERGDPELNAALSRLNPDNAEALSIALSIPLSIPLSKG